MPNLKPKLLREQEPDKLRETLFDLSRTNSPETPT